MPAKPEPWLEVRVGDVQRPQSIIASLFALGSGGVEERDSEIVTYFPASVLPDDITKAIKAADSTARISISAARLSSVAESRGEFRKQQVGRLTISPPWLARGLDPSTTVIIDPAMAFGTGDHATTRGVLRLMQTIPLAGKVVADLGAGSGILAIAAAKLGASRVIAIEVDPDAAGNALENIAANECGTNVHFIEGDASVLLPLVAPVDVILANILSSVLIGLLPVMRDALAPDGKAILSGVLIEERPAMLGAFDRSGWKLDEEDNEAEWWSSLISRA